MIIGLFPIIILIFYICIMDIRHVLANHIGQPWSHQVMTSWLKDYKRPNDKIHELMEQGVLMSLKKGLYIPGPQLGLATPEPFLLANHIWGPSYVSIDSALSHHGLVPERVYGVSSATIKHTRAFDTPIGMFHYTRIPLPYYAYGIQQVELAENQVALMAGPEKALCDKVVTSVGIQFRSIKDAREYVLENLRVDEYLLGDMDTEAMKSWLANAPKANTLSMMIKMIERL